MHDAALGQLGNPETLDALVAKASLAGRGGVSSVVARELVPAICRVAVAPSARHPGGPRCLAPLPHAIVRAEKLPGRDAVLLVHARGVDVARRALVGRLRLWTRRSARRQDVLRPRRRARRKYVLRPRS